MQTASLVRFAELVGLSQAEVCADVVVMYPAELKQNFTRNVQRQTKAGTQSKETTLTQQQQKKDSKWEQFSVMTELLSRAAVEDVKGVKGNIDTNDVTQGYS